MKHLTRPRDGRESSLERTTARYCRAATTRRAVDVASTQRGRNLATHEALGKQPGSLGRMAAGQAPERSPPR